MYDPFEVMGTITMPLTGAIYAVTCCIVDSIGMYFQKWDCPLKICAFAPPSTCILLSDTILKTFIIIPCN